MSSNVIAIDGTAYSGKSHIAKGLSKLTGFEYINTGHMYRAFACFASMTGVNLDNDDALSAMKFRVQFSKGKTIVFPNDGNEQIDWTDALDSPDIVQAASRIAVLPKVRQRLTALQRVYEREQFIIMEGRDIGTTVFPDALCRIYVTADVDVRAKRLYKTLSESERKKSKLPVDQFILQLRDEKLVPIDRMDANRKISPLISEATAEKLGYYIHRSPEHYSVEDDVRDIYEKYVKKELEKIGIHR